jgi:hypothetical protein
MTRRTHEKYKMGICSCEVGAALKQLCPNIAELLTWLEKNLKATEVIDVHQWYGDFFYIIIDDLSMHKDFEYPQYMRCGFTVNVKTDKMKWNDDNLDGQQGGNCFVRSPKWKGLIKKKWLGVPPEEKIHMYKDRKRGEGVIMKEEC